jgi:hypothetical protein
MRCVKDGRRDRMAGPAILAVLAVVVGLGCFAAAAVDGLEANFVCTEDGPGFVGNCREDARTWFSRNPAPVGLAIGLVGAAATLLAIRLTQDRRNREANQVRGRHAKQLFARIDHVTDSDSQWELHLRNDNGLEIRNISVLIRDPKSPERTQRLSVDSLPGKSKTNLALPARPMDSGHDVIVSFTDAADVRWWLNTSSGELHEI